jgi:hypothetical protein
MFLDPLPGIITVWEFWLENGVEGSVDLAGATR